MCVYVCVCARMTQQTFFFALDGFLLTGICKNSESPFTRQMHAFKLSQFAWFGKMVIVMIVGNILQLK